MTISTRASILAVLVACIGATVGTSGNDGRRDREPQGTPPARHGNRPRPYSFGPVTLEGLVVVKTEYGPPGFENDGESPRVHVRMLALDTPIAVACGTPSPCDSDPVSWIRRIQIVELEGRDLSKMVGKRVKLEGVLDGARTGHHYTSAILVIDKNARVEVLGSRARRR